MRTDPRRELAALYSRVAEGYVERGPPRFAHAGRMLVEVARPEPGDAVLDVATGRGAVLLPAAERVGSSGRVVGIDIAAEMVRRTRTTLAERHVHWATVELMDAEQLEFADRTFKHVLCSFAVFFFPDLSTVLAEMWRVLRPGGLVGFAFERGADPRWAWYEDLLRERGALEHLPAVPGSGSIRDDGALVARLASAGFLEPRETVEQVELGYPDAASWWASLWTHGARRPLERLAADRLAEIKAACLERARLMTGPDGLPERHRFVYVTARRPQCIPTSAEPLSPGQPRERFERSARSARQLP